MGGRGVVTEVLSHGCACCCIQLEAAFQVSADITVATVVLDPDGYSEKEAYINKVRPMSDLPCVGVSTFGN